MKLKTLAGWALLIAISLSPIFLWLRFGPGIQELSGYQEITHSLGELFGLVGMTMFALTFILSTRITLIEDIFDGLDKVYIAHAILGGSALILILAHPIFLVLKFVPAQTDLAAKYLLPSSYWSVNLGIIALVGMIALIMITLFTKIKYHRWKFTHEFLGPIFILAALHIFLVRNSIAQDNIFAGYYIYAAAVSAIGIFGYSYSLFIKERVYKNAVYSISSIQTKDEVIKITITPEHKPISYRSGQFIFIRFYNENISKEAHPFSIASRSNDNDITVYAKNLGDYTSKMVHLKKGDKVSVEGPYGRFNYKRYSKSEQVWIAGGIGITPFIGMAQDIFYDPNPESNITLIYSVKEKKDLIGGKLFYETSQKTDKFKIVPWISQTQGRINTKIIFDRCGRFRDKEFFICGPAGFKEGIIESLIKNGVSKDHIHEEAFDFK